jgi:hypothetical protein
MLNNSTNDALSTDIDPLSIDRLTNYIEQALILVPQCPITIQIHQVTLQLHPRFL